MIDDSMDLLDVVATLTHEFPDLSLNAVVRSVRQAVDERPQSDAVSILREARQKVVHR